MLKDSISKIKYLLVLALLFVIPIQADAGGGVNLSNTDDAQSRQTSFWDLRDRESFVQITNISTNDLCVHVQIFNVNGDVVCEEVNFPDCYTGNDTQLFMISVI